MVQTTKFRADVNIKDFKIAEQPIDYVIHYLKTTTGNPTGTGLLDEFCLNIFDKTLFKFDGSAWISVVFGPNTRFCFGGHGSASSGCGNNTPDNLLYDYNGSLFSSKEADDGIAILVKNKSKDFDQNILIIYNKNGNNWIVNASAGSTPSVTNEDIDDRVAQLLQEGEGIDLNYNDSSDILTVSCEIAESGNSSANKGISCFDSTTFNVINGFVQITSINGGTF